jgi:hypothetical protein
MKPKFIKKEIKSIHETLKEPNFTDRIDSEFVKANKIADKMIDQVKTVLKENKKPDHLIKKPYIQAKEPVFKEPEGKKQRILKQNEHICANPDCRKAFTRDKFEQKYCSVKCEAHVKVTHVNHKEPVI